MDHMHFSTTDPRRTSWRFLTRRPNRRIRRSAIEWSEPGEWEPRDGSLLVFAGYPIHSHVYAVTPGGTDVGKIVVLDRTDSLPLIGTTKEFLIAYLADDQVLYGIGRERPGDEGRQSTAGTIAATRVGKRGEELCPDAFPTRANWNGCRLLAEAKAPRLQGFQSMGARGIEPRTSRV
jgi:hypothetical protein